MVRSMNWKRHAPASRSVPLQPLLVAPSLLQPPWLGAMFLLQLPSFVAPKVVVFKNISLKLLADAAQSSKQMLKALSDE